MNRIGILISLLLIGIMTSLPLSGQCEPDTANCKDIGNPGEFCPLTLPEAGLNALYDETVTIIPPGSFEFYGTMLNIFYIEIDSVKNLPPGIDYFPNSDVFHPDTAYCIQLTGTPTQTGEFPLAIYITATVDFGGPVTAQVRDDTSVVITVVESLGFEPFRHAEFQVYQNVPNPFSFRTSINFYTPVRDRIELSVYNILGVLVHQESDWAAQGEHQFRFDGTELQPGTYLYRVKNREGYYTGRFMKSK